MVVDTHPAFRAIRQVVDDLPNHDAAVAPWVSPDG